MYNILDNNHLTLAPNFLKIGRGSRCLWPNNILKKFLNRPETNLDTDIRHLRRVEEQAYDTSLVLHSIFGGTGRGNLNFFILVDSTIGVVW